MVSLLSPVPSDSSTSHTTKWESTGRRCTKGSMPIGEGVRAHQRCTATQLPTPCSGDRCIHNLFRAHFTINDRLTGLSPVGDLCKIKQRKKQAAGAMAVQCQCLSGALLHQRLSQCTLSMPLVFLQRTYVSCGIQTIRVNSLHQCAAGSACPACCRHPSRSAQLPCWHQSLDAE